MILVHLITSHVRTPKGVEVGTGCGLTLTGKVFRDLDATAWSTEVTCQDCQNRRPA